MNVTIEQSTDILVRIDRVIRGCYIKCDGRTLHQPQAQRIADLVARQHPLLADAEVSYWACIHGLTHEVHPQFVDGECVAFAFIIDFDDELPF